MHLIKEKLYVFLFISFLEISTEKPSGQTDWILIPSLQPVISTTVSSVSSLTPSILIDTTLESIQTNLISSSTTNEASSKPITSGEYERID